MSKIIKPLLVIAVAVAVVVFAPQIAALLGPAIFGGIGLVGIGTMLAIQSALVGIGLSVALTATMGLFRKQPSMSQSMADRLNTSINPTAARKIIFGTSAAGADVRFQEGDVDLPKTKKDGLAQIIAAASHRIAGFRSWYVEDELTWTPATGITGKYRSGLRDFKYITEGSASNTFTYGSGRYWTGTGNRFTGCAYYAPLYCLDPEVWPSGVPTRTTLIVDGCPVYDPRRDSTRGGSGSHRLGDQSTYTFREGSIEVGRNPALCLLTYLIGWKIGGKLAWGMGIPVERLDLDAFGLYANICEERVSTQSGGSVQRYTCDVSVSTSDTHETITGILTAAMGSCKLSDRGGVYCLIGGYDDTAGPKIAFDADDLVAPVSGSSPYTWAPAAASRETYNIVRGRYADPSALYQLSDWGDPIETDTLFDGIPRTMTLDLAAVSRPETCQRIAKQFLLREAMTPGHFSAVFGAKAFAVQVGDCVTLSLPAEGWNAKLFRVMEQAEAHDLFFQMTLREESSEVYAWDREEKPLPATIRPQPYDPSTTITPANLALTSDSYAGANRYNVSEVHVTWTPETSGRVAGIQIQSRPVGVDIWSEQAALYDPSAGNLTFTSNAPGIQIEVRARYRMTNAIYSPWVSATVNTQAIVTSTDWENVTNDSGNRPSPGATVGVPDGYYVGGDGRGGGGGMLAQDLVNKVSANPNLDTTAPAAPTGLTLTSVVAPDGRSTTLTAKWNSNGESDFSTYELQVSTNGGDWVTVLSGTSITWTATLPPNTPVQARIRALDIATNRSAYSSTVSHTTARDTTPPAAPTNLVASPGFNTVNLSVACPTDADVKAIRFWSASTNDFSKATPAGQVNAPNTGATVRFAIPQAAGTSLYWFATAFDTSLNESAATAGVLATVTKLSEADFTPGLSPVKVLTSLSDAGTEGQNGTLAGKLYLYTGGAWKAVVNTTDLAGQITGTQIADNSISTPKLVAGSVTTAALASSSVSTDKLVAGSVSADKIAANAITASKIGVLGASLFPDGQMTDQAWWTSNPTGKQAGYQNIANAYYIDGNPDPATVTAKGSLNAWVSSGNLNGNTAPNIQIVAPILGGAIPGETYEAKATLYNSSNRPAWTFNLQWFGVNSDGSVKYLDGAGANCVNDSTSRQLSLQSKAPTGAVYWRLYWDAQGTTSGWTGQVYTGGITMRQCAGGSLIVDGSITTAKITADKLSGNVLQVGTVNADRLQSSTSLPASLKIGPAGYELSTVAQSTAIGTGGANRVPYSDMVLGLKKWSPYYNTANGWQSQGWNYFGSLFQNRQFLKLENSNASAGQDIAIYSPVNNEMLFPVTGGERLSVSCRVEGQNLSSQYCYVWFYDASGNQVGQPPQAFNIGSQTYGYLAGGFLDVPNTAAKARIEIHGTVAANGYASILLCEPMVCQAAPGQIFTSAYAPGPNPDAAAIVNANTTRIDPGKITISGATTLSDWRYGGDTTTINGGAIAANTIVANKISIGVRGVQPINLYFDTDRNQTVTWNNGIIEYYDEAYNRITTQLNAGSCTRNINSGGTGVILVWFDRSQVGNAGNGVTNLYAAETSVANVSSNPNNVILALYFGYNSLQVSYGQTIIDGDYVKTGTVNANRLIANTITSRELSANSIQAGHITASSIDTSKITVGGVATRNITGNAVTTFYAWANSNSYQGSGSGTQTSSGGNTSGGGSGGGGFGGGGTRNTQQV